MLSPSIYDAEDRLASRMTAFEMFQEAKRAREMSDRFRAMREPEVARTLLRRADRWQERADAKARERQFAAAGPVKERGR